MSDQDHELAIRRHLVEALHADLIGPFVAPEHPSGGEEILPLPPSRWYLTGFLAPQGARTPDVDDEDSREGGLTSDNDTQAEDAGNTEPEAKRPVRFPASMGLSVFLPPGEGDSLTVDLSFADYDKVEIAEDHDKRTRWGWKRVPHGAKGITIPLTRDVLEGRDGISVPNTSGLRFRGELRTTEIDGLPPGARMLSLFLVNERTVLDTDRDLAFVFQVQFTLRYDKGFLSRPNRRGEDADDDDQKVLALNFRDKVEWAVGHNTSVVSPLKESGVVRALTTTQLPAYEVPRVEHVTFEGVLTRMADLAKLDADGLERGLSPLIEAYSGWIDEQVGEHLERDALKQTRNELVTKARMVKSRMREGIELLKSDAQIREAFKLTNQAMYVAATQADSLRADKRYRDGRATSSDSVVLW